MATKTVETRIDDVDQGTKNVNPYKVGFTDGEGKTTTFEIDLSDKNAGPLKDSWALLKEFGRVVTNPAAPVAVKGKKGKAAKAAAGANDAAEVRAWAAANNVAFNPRGRISADLRAAFDAAQSGAASSVVGDAA